MSAIAPLPVLVSPSPSTLKTASVANLWKWAGIALATDAALRAEIASLEQQLASANNVAAAIARIEAAVKAGVPGTPLPPSATDRYERTTWRFVPKAAGADARDFAYEQHLVSSTQAAFDVAGVLPVPSLPPVPVDRIVGPTSAIPLIAGTDVWTLDKGVAILNGVPTPSDSVILLYRDPLGIVWQENVNQGWWKWTVGAPSFWQAAPAPL